MMEEMRPFRCLRCGHEFTAVHQKDGALVERTCPKCRSNSIRVKKDDQAPATGPAKPR
jgi:predicted Zn-ribbon and HTH transcriptional regulator